MTDLRSSWINGSLRFRGLWGAFPLFALIWVVCNIIGILGVGI